MSTAERLKTVRTAARLSYEELGQRANLSDVALFELETGQSAIYPQEDAALCAAFNLVPGFFQRKAPLLNLRPASPKLAAFPEADAALISAQALLWAERMLDLNALMPADERRSPATPPEGFPVTMEADDLPQLPDAAVAARMGWGLSTYALPHLVDVLEYYGFILAPIPADLSQPLDACAFWLDTPIPTPVIGYNPQLPADFQRMAIARELGYYMITNLGDFEADNADLFGVSFIMPPNVLAWYFGASRTNIHPVELRQLQALYGITEMDLIFLLQGVGILSEEYAAALMQDYETIEPIETTPELPSLAQLQALRLQQRGEIDAEMAAQLLGIDLALWQQTTSLQWQDQMSKRLTALIAQRMQA